MSRRVLAFIAVSTIALAGCMSTPAFNKGTSGDRGCPVVSIVNDNYADVVVRDLNLGGRVGFVSGHTTKAVEYCLLIDRVPTFGIHAIGGAFDLTLRSRTGYTAEGQTVHVYIGPSPNLSWVY